MYVLCWLNFQAFIGILSILCFLLFFFAFGAGPNATVTKMNIALLKIRHGRSEFCVVSKKN